MEKYKKSKSTQDVVEGLLAGKANLPPHGTINFTEISEWVSFRKTDPNIEFKLHSFKWAAPLLKDNNNQRFEEQIACWDKLFCQWLNQYDNYERAFKKKWFEYIFSRKTNALLSRRFPNPSYTKTILGPWNDHAVAQRAEQIAQRLQTQPTKKWIIEAAQEHLTLLIRNDFYKQKSNHGLNQISGLLHLSQALSNEYGTNLALRRLEKYILDCIDENGVLHEQSIKYQKYVYIMLSGLIKSTKSYNLPFKASLLLKVQRMQWLLHVTQLKGKQHLLIGDGNFPGFQRDSKLDWESQPECSASHEIIENDAFRIDIFPQQFLIIKSKKITHGGAPQFIMGVSLHGKRRFHGHWDTGAPSLMINGEYVILPSGTYKYDIKDLIRQYILSPQSQNIIQVNNAFFCHSCRITNTQVNEAIAKIRLKLLDSKNRQWYREFYIDLTRSSLSIQDEFDGHFQTQFRISYVQPMPSIEENKAVQFKTQNSTIRFTNKLKKQSLVRGKEKPRNGWVSLQYGKWQPCATITCQNEEKSTIELSWKKNE